MFRLVCTMVCVLWACAPHSAFSCPEPRSETHAAWYQHYAEQYLPIELDERPARLSAQCYQESRFNPLAFNKTSGAAGECQFMAGTWSDYLRAHNLTNISRLNQRHSVKAAAWYDRRLSFMWTTPRPADENWRLVLASYNAGIGHIINAQKASGDQLYWPGIYPYLHTITGRHSAETIDYVEKIEQWTPCFLNNGD